MSVKIKGRITRNIKDDMRIGTYNKGEVVDVEVRYKVYKHIFDPSTGGTETVIDFMEGDEVDIIDD